MTRVKSVFRMHWRDKLAWLYLPWGTTLFSFVVNLMVGAAILETDYYSGSIGTIFVYLFVAGIVTVPQTFPYMLGMGIRRTDYVLGTLALAAWVSLFSTAGLLFLSVVERSWIPGWGVGMHFFHLPFVHDGSLIGQAVSMFVLLMNMFLAGFAIAGIYRKFGKIGLFSFFTVLFLIAVIAPLLITHFQAWPEIGRWLVAHFRTMQDVTPWLLLLTVIYAAASYGMFRKSTI